MKKLTAGVFESRDAAEKAINYLHNEIKIPTSDISFIYRNVSGETREVDASQIPSKTPSEGAKTGAAVGGTLGALLGLAVVAGVIPVIGPILAAGPLITALGISGAVGTAAAGALTGAAAGGLLGALANLGIGKENAQRYADLVAAGDILLIVYAEEGVGITEALKQMGATEVEAYVPSV
ncbi:MAG: hypothetical protein V4481_00680 [Patescibacteria group bacterium]